MSQVLEITNNKVSPTTFTFDHRWTDYSELDDIVMVVIGKSGKRFAATNREIFGLTNGGKLFRLVPEFKLSPNHTIGTIAVDSHDSVYFAEIMRIPVYHSDACHSVRKLDSSGAFSTLAGKNSEKGFLDGDGESALGLVPYARWMLMGTTT